MPPVKIEIGQKINYLTFLSKAPRKIGKTGLVYTQWNCLCDCGNNVIVTTKEIGKGRKCCGCSTIIGKFKLSPEAKLFSRKIKIYKRHAEDHNRVFELTDEECETLFLSNCYYCNCPPQLKFEPYLTAPQKRTYPRLSTTKVNGIDRKDNSGGYTLGNVVSSCFVCNRAKGDMPYDKFIEWIKAMARFHYNKMTETEKAEITELSLLYVYS
jgi:hypothetical protein